MSRETIVSIAQRTGFSISTVSRVLSGQARKYKISHKTIEIISREAEACNYTPSLLAKGLRMKKTNTIGLLIPSIDNHFFANIASIIIRETKELGYTTILVDSIETELNERSGLASLMSRSVDAIIVASSCKTPHYLEEINRTSMPVVLIDRHFEETALPYVCTNNYQGSLDATSYLIHNGHRDILCLQGVTHSMPSKERVRGYMDALDMMGLRSHAMVSGNDFSIQNGYLETKLALSRGKPFTAIFALSNTILLGALKALKEANLSVPRDISIISFDDETYLDYMDPAITRVRQPVEEIAMTAIKILLANIEAKDSGTEGNTVQIQLSPSFVIRNSAEPVNVK